MGDIDDLISAARDGDRHTLDALLKSTPDLVGATNDGGTTPLMAAIEAGRTEIVDALRERGAEIDVFAAAALGDTERIVALRPQISDRRFRFNPQGWTVLHLAARHGHTDALRVLLDAGAYLPQLSRTPLTNSPLHEALQHGRRDAAELLIDRGARIDTLDGRNWSTLHMAVASGSLEVVRLLVDRGAPLSERRDNGQTALDMALDAGRDDIAEMLRAAGAAEA